MGPQDEILEFPTPFSLKVVGADEDDFQMFVVAIFRKHVSQLDEAAITQRPSRGGKYVSITIPFVAESRLQLDALYRELGLQPRVLMVL